MKNLKTLSISFKEREYSEKIYQNMVAEKIDSDHSDLQVDELLLKKEFTTLFMFFKLFLYKIKLLINKKLKEYILCISFHQYPGKKNYID